MPRDEVDKLKDRIDEPESEKNNLIPLRDMGVPA